MTPYEHLDPDWEEEIPDFEHGEAHQIDDRLEPEEKSCPQCGRPILTVNRGADVVIGVYCKKCKERVCIVCRPEKKIKIGFQP